jgi:predicted HAD superfamily Cof-like phosphohydrolase
MSMHGPSDGSLSRNGGVDIAAAVAEFHKAFGLPASDVPSSDVDRDLAKLRVALLEEEVSEFVTASEKGDLVGIADALADITYVVYGTALTYGIDLDAILREVHRSNMSKLDGDGKPLIRADGKVLKSDRYLPPDIEAVLSRRARSSRGRPGETLSSDGQTRPDS